MRYGCGCALVIVTALVVTVVLVIMQWVGGGGQQPGQAESTVPITGSAAVLSDGVTIVYSDPNGLCRTEDLTATETSARVVLSLSGSERLDDLGCAGFGTGGPAGSPGGPAMGGNPASTATVTLGSPLGDRRLVDAVTGRTIPCFDLRGGLLLPRMAGWSQWPAPDDFTTNVPYFGGPGAAVLAERLFGTNPGTFVRNGMSLMIVQVAGGGWHPPDGTVTTHVLVRGRPGLAAPGIIVWSEGGHTIAALGEGQAPAGESGGVQSQPPLPLASLEAIARNLIGDGQA
jgi:hypothetical protein